jgi:hypothetical protein
MITVIDNFFDDPDLIRNYAMTVDYRSPRQNDGWRGFRSNQLNANIPTEKFVIESIESSLSEIFEKTIKSDIYFHCSPEFIMQEVQNFHDYKYHEDDSDCAGIVYLTPNPPKNSGTCIKGVKCIENVYNRLLTYPGKLTHGPDNLFGNDLSTTRLTVTFFCKFI